MLSKIMLSYKEGIGCVLILWVVWKKGPVVFEINRSDKKLQEIEVWLSSGLAN